MWKFLVPVAAFVGLVVMFAFGLDPKRDISALPSPLIGKAAPEFALTDVLDPSRTVSNRSLRGQIYVFNVFGTWCGGCRQEHGTLLEIAEQRVVPIVGLDWNNVPAESGERASTDERDKAAQWLRQLGNPYQAVAYDAEGRTAIDWGVYGAPETFLVDRDGRVLFKHIAPLTLDVWQREFLPRIEAARGGGA